MKKFQILILGAALFGFLAGLMHLIRLRFESGDNFPPYSSYRADPVGTKAFYESVEALVSAQRNLQPLSRLGEGRDSTLLWLGAPPQSLRLQTEEFKDLETFIRSGGRLVIAAVPLVQRPRTNLFALAAARRGASTNAPGEVPAEFRKIDIQERWELAFDYTDLEKRDPEHFDPVTASLQGDAAPPTLPRTLSFHTALWFNRLDPGWRVLYARGSGTNVQPVLIERTLGRGTVVLLADSFFFSNEALRDDRQPGLLSWLAGTGRQVIFEETHLGTSENPGVATLARKYRLQPLFAALLVLALLFLWKNASGLMPPYEQQLARERGEVVEGRDSAGAFVNLLRRNITPASLLRVCLEQWNSALAGLRKPARHKLEEMQRLIDAQNALDPREQNPVATYREFCRILARRPGTGVPDSDVSTPAAAVSPSRASPID